VPFRGCVVEISQVLPGVGELAIERFDWNIVNTMAGGDFGVDVTDGRPRLNESAADVEGDCPELGEWINGLMDWWNNRQDWRSIR
jgi:hypothetical protein